MEDHFVSSSSNPVRKEYVDLLEYVCATCVSQNRALYHLGEEVQELMITLSIKVPNVNKVCWECYALLKNVLRFKETAARAQQILIKRDWKSLVTVKLSRLKVTEPVQTTTPLREQNETIVISESPVGKPESISSRNNVTNSTQDCLKEKQDSTRQNCIVIQPPPIALLNKTLSTSSQPLKSSTMSQNVVCSDLKSNLPKIARKPVPTNKKIKSSGAAKVNTEENEHQEAYKKVAKEPIMTHKTIYLVDPRHPSESFTKVKVKQQKRKTTAYLSLGPAKRTTDAMLLASAQSVKKTTTKVLKRVDHCAVIRPINKTGHLKQLIPNTVHPVLTKAKPSIIKIVNHHVGIKPKATTEIKDLVVDPDEIKFDNVIPVFVKTQTNAQAKKLIRGLVKSKQRSKKVNLLQKTTMPMLAKSQMKSTPDDTPVPVGIKTESSEIIDLDSETDEIISNPKFPTKLETKTIISDTDKDLAFDPVRTRIADSGKSPETLNNLVLHHLKKHLYADIKTNKEKTKLDNFASESNKNTGLEITTDTRLIEIEPNPESRIKKIHASVHTLPLFSDSLIPTSLECLQETAHVPSSDTIVHVQVEEARPQVEAMNYYYQPKTLSYYSCIALNIKPEKHDDLQRASDNTLSSNAALPILHDSLIKPTLDNASENVTEFVELKPIQTHELLSDAFESANKAEPNCIEMNLGPRSESLFDDPIVTIVPEKITTGTVSQLVETQTITTDKINEITQLPTPDINNDALEDIVMKSVLTPEIDSKSLDIETVNERVRNSVQTDARKDGEIVINNLCSAKQLQNITVKTLAVHPTRIRAVKNIVIDPVNTFLTTDIEIPLIPMIPTNKQQNYMKTQPVITYEISGDHVEHCNEITTIPNTVFNTMNNSGDIKLDNSLNTVYILQMLNVLDTSNISDNVSLPKEINSKFINADIENQNVENMVILCENDNLPFLHCTENIHDNDDLLADNNSKQTNFHLKKVKISQQPPEAQSDANYGHINFNNIAKNVKDKNKQQLVVRRITAENSTKHNITEGKPNNSNYNTYEEIIEIKDEDITDLRRVKRKPKSKKVKQSKPNVVYYFDPYNQLNINDNLYSPLIVVSEEYKHLLIDHGYCEYYIFKFISGGNNNQIILKQHLNEKMKERVTLKQQMRASEGYIKNVIQNIVDGFENEELNAIQESDQEQVKLQSGTYGEKEPCKEHLKYRNNNKTKYMLSSGMGTSNDMIHVERPDGINNSISVDIKVEPCDETTPNNNVECYDNYDWSVQRCQRNAEHFDFKYVQDVETDTASETSNLDNAMQELNYHRDDINTQCNLDQGDKIRVPPGYIRDDSLQYYTDYELKAIEATSEDDDDFYSNITTFSTTVFDSELNNAPVYSTDNTEVNDLTDADNDCSRNSSPSLLEPIYFTDWEDTTYDHVLEKKETKSNKKKFYCKNKEASYKTETNRKIVTSPLLNRKRKCSDLNNSDVIKYKTRRVTKKIESEDVKIKQECDLEGICDKLLLRPIVLLDKLDANLAVKRKSKDLTDEQKGEYDQSIKIKVEDSQLNKPIETNAEADTVDVSDQVDPKLIKNDENDVMPIENSVKRPKITLRDTASLLKPSVLVYLNEKVIIKGQSAKPEESASKNDELVHKDEVFYDVENKIDDKPIRQYNLWHQQYADMYKKRILQDGELEMLRDKVRNGKDFLNAKYKCEKCVRVLSNKQYYMIHISKYHETSNRSLACEICECKFDKRGTWKAHVAKHKICYACKMCDSEEYLYLRDLHEHVKMNHFENKPAQVKKTRRRLKEWEKKYGCRLCIKKYGQRMWLLRHLKAVHELEIDELSSNEDIELLLEKKLNATNDSSNTNNTTDNCTGNTLNTTENDLNAAENYLNTSENDLNASENNSSLPENSFSTTENCFLPENSFGTTEYDSSVDENRSSTAENDLSQPKNRLSLVGSRLSTTENDLNLAKGRLSTTENDLSLLEIRLSTTENVISLAEDRLNTTESNLNYCDSSFNTTDNFSVTGESFSATEIDLSSSEISLRLKKDSRDNLICIDDNMIVMEYTVDITANEFSPQKESTLLTSNFHYANLQTNRDLNSIENLNLKSLNQLDNSAQSELDINSMEFTILGLLPNDSEQEHINQTKNNVIVMEKDLFDNGSHNNVSESSISVPENHLNHTENTLSVVENKLNDLNKSVSFNFVENYLSPEENNVNVMENDLIFMEFGKM